MSRERRAMVDRPDGSSRSESGFRRERMGERVRGSTQHLAVEERGVDVVMMSRNGDGHMRTFSRFNDQDFPIRINDTTSKFQWTNLLRESVNSMVDGVERGFQDSRQANYGRKSIPIEGERGLPTYAHNAGSVEYRGHTRNMTGLLVEGSDNHGRSRDVMTGLLVEDSNYHGRNRNVVTDLPNEGAEYHRHNRNVTGPRIEDNGHTRNMTGLRIEVSYYNGNTRNMTGLPLEDAEYNGFTRKETGLPVEDAEYHRHARTVMTSHPVEDGGRFLIRNCPRRMDRDISTKSYEGNRLRFWNEESSRSLIPRSQSSGQQTPLRGIPFSNLESPCQGVFHHPADCLGTGGNIPSSGCYSSHGMVYYKTGSNAYPISNKGSIYSGAECNSNMGRHVEYVHSENQRSGKVYRRALSEDTYDKCENVQDYNDHGDTFENDILDHAIPRHDSISNSCKYALEEDELHRSDRPLQEAPFMNIDDIRTGQKIEYGGVNLKSMERYNEYQTQASYETTTREEEFPDEIDAHGVLYEDQARNHPIFEEKSLNMDEDEHQILGPGDVLHDQPKRMSKRKRGSVGKMSWPKHRISTLGGRGSLSYDDRLLNDECENELAHSTRSSSHHFHSKANARMSKTKSRLPFGGLSKELQRRLSKPYESGGNDVKSRLKHPQFSPRLHGPQASHISRGNVKTSVKSSLNGNHIDPQPFGKAKRTSTKKRLKPAPYMDVCPSDSQVSHPGPDIESQPKLATKNSGSKNEAGLPQEADPDYSILKVKPTEKDPPENSEELKCLMDQWFLKCMLYLNANPGRQKKFKEQGKAGTLKCIICSSSKEFIQAKDVATHAFTSLKVGLRAAHLGFHRALCVLMGWDPAFASNDRWVCKSLPAVEAWALKEDIIVWPPVVIIYNGSARDFYSNEQVKISIEQLENILRDMGLSEGKTSLCHGKPGNPNIMLVKFNGTLSGLQEAERLHNVFFEKKHGRAELQEIDAGIGCNEVVAQKPEDKIEDALVKFNGTLSGLQEAERLHNVFLENHGRAEHQEIDAGIGCNEVVDQKPQDKIEDALVKLNGTPSGLQEDERLHNVFSEKKHGRAKLQDIDAGIGCSEVVAQKPEDKIEDAMVKFNGTHPGLQEAERFHNMFPKKEHGRAELQEIDAGIGCNEVVPQKLDDKIEDVQVKFNGTLSVLQEAERVHNVFSEKNHGSAELPEVDAGIGCSEVVAQKPEDKIEDAQVKFNGTHPGLQEAERCHNMFPKKKHGRAELQEIDAGIGCNEVVLQKLEDKIEDVQVKFNGTLSVLQEAERFHNVFSEKNHGRAELQEIDAGIGCDEVVAQKPEDKIYGYLGIVEDFDKLNYDMRRHCVAKSKKEILACMDIGT